jgi:hypothetical protein
MNSRNNFFPLLANKPRSYPLPRLRFGLSRRRFLIFSSILLILLRIALRFAPAFASRMVPRDETRTVGEAGLAATPTGSCSAGIGLLTGAPTGGCGSGKGLLAGTPAAGAGVGLAGEGIAAVGALWERPLPTE